VTPGDWRDVLLPIRSGREIPMDTHDRHLREPVPLGMWWTNILLFSVVAWAALFQALF